MSITLSAVLYISWNSVRTFNHPLIFADAFNSACFSGSWKACHACSDHWTRQAILFIYSPTLYHLCLRMPSDLSLQGSSWRRLKLPYDRIWPLRKVVSSFLMVRIFSPAKLLMRRSWTPSTLLHRLPLLPFSLPIISHQKTFIGLSYCLSTLGRKSVCHHIYHCHVETVSIFLLSMHAALVYSSNWVLVLGPVLVCMSLAWCLFLHGSNLWWPWWWPLQQYYLVTCNCPKSQILLLCVSWVDALEYPSPTWRAPWCYWVVAFVG